MGRGGVGGVADWPEFRKREPTRPGNCRRSDPREARGRSLSRLSLSRYILLVALPRATVIKLRLMPRPSNLSRTMIKFARAGTRETAVASRLAARCFTGPNSTGPLETVYIYGWIAYTGCPILILLLTYLEKILFRSSPKFNETFRIEEGRWKYNFIRPNLKMAAIQWQRYLFFNGITILFSQ